MFSTTPADRTGDLQRALDSAVTKYREGGDRTELLESLAALSEGRTPEELSAAIDPYRHIPEVAGPVCERIVEAQPDNVRALVSLANAYWLTGRGPEVVGDLAARAIAADPTSRGAWHLWSLSEGDPRARAARWRQVVARFPDDDLARASLADNLASLAGAEHDIDALDDAIEEFEALLTRASHPDQMAAIEGALKSLRGWKL